MAFQWHSQALSTGGGQALSELDKRGGNPNELRLVTRFVTRKVHCNRVESNIFVEFLHYSDRYLVTNFGLLSFEVNYDLIFYNKHSLCKASL